MQNKNIGTQIKLCRQRAGIKQEELAFSAGVTKNAVSLWERNKKVPGGDTLLKILKILDCVEIFFPEYTKKANLEERLRKIESSLKI